MNHTIIITPTSRPHRPVEVRHVLLAATRVLTTPETCRCHERL